MITTEQLTALISDGKSGGDPPTNSKYHPNNIIAIADIVRNTLIETEYKQTGIISDVLIKPFDDVKVLQDDGRNEPFSDLPSTIAAINGSLALHQVSPMKDQIGVFDIGANGSRAVFDGLDGQLTERTTVYLEGNKLFYENINPSVTEVLVKMIPSIFSLDKAEPIPVPGNKEKLFIDLINEMLDEPKKTVQDKSNDSNYQQQSNYQRMRGGL